MFLVISFIFCSLNQGKYLSSELSSSIGSIEIPKSPSRLNGQDTEDVISSNDSLQEYIEQIQLKQKAKTERNKK